MTDRERWAWALGQADQAFDLARRCAVVDAILKGHAVGLSLVELIDLAGETEACLVYADREKVARTFASRAPVALP